MAKPKRVKFADTNLAYSPMPPTPSPSQSTYSLPSSPDIPTPPPQLPELEDDPHDPYPRTPFAQPYDLCVTEPQDYEEEMQVHCCLAYTPYSEPTISHDLSLPAMYSIADHFPPLPLDEPATNPPLSYLTIVCPEYLKWDISIKASSPFAGSFVTVHDILNALYVELRLPVTQQEYDGLGQSKKAVDAAYFSRIQRIADPESRAMEAAKGVKRIDYLTGKNKFMGLSLTHNGPDTWELNVS